MNQRTFTARAAKQSDYKLGVQYFACSSANLSPGQIAREVLGDQIDSALLFKYCFRRFGPPNRGCDDYKEIANYALTTPLDDLFLIVEITGSDMASLSFGYSLPWELEREIGAERGAVNAAFHERFKAWRAANGIVLPRDTRPPLSIEAGDFDDDIDGGFDYAKDSAMQGEALERYRVETGDWYDDYLSCQKTNAALAALRAALEDLKRPVSVRDRYFSAVARKVDPYKDNPMAKDLEERDDDAIGIARRHSSAGHSVPTEFFDDPKTFHALVDVMNVLGNGSISDGMKALLAGSATLMLKPYDGAGRLMTIDEFIQFDADDSLTDEDGAGYWATAAGVSGAHICKVMQPKWATHILWVAKDVAAAS